MTDRSGIARAGGSRRISSATIVKAANTAAATRNGVVMPYWVASRTVVTALTADPHTPMPRTPTARPRCVTGTSRYERHPHGEGAARGAEKHPTHTNRPANDRCPASPSSSTATIATSATDRNIRRPPNSPPSGPILPVAPPKTIPDG
jgi:hypothetical protein